MAVWRRQATGADLTGLVHHSDRGVQYRVVRYTQRLAETDAVASAGSKGDSYDNAMAGAFNSLYKAELVRNRGPWRGIDHVEIATAEYEALHAMTHPVTATLETNQPSLHETRGLTGWRAPRFSDRTRPTGRS